MMIKYRKSLIRQYTEKKINKTIQTVEKEEEKDYGKKNF